MRHIVRELSALRTLSAVRREALIEAFECSCDRMTRARLHRLTKILRRSVFATEPLERLCAQMRISRKRFYADRSEALRRLSRLLDTKVALTSTAVPDPSLLLLTQARAMYDAGNSSRTVALLSRIDDRALLAGDRFDVFRLTVDALDDLRALPLQAEHLERRIDRWRENSAEGSPDRHLANAADRWLRARHTGGAASLMRPALTTSDPSTTIAYCRVLLASAPAFITGHNRGDAAAAELQLQEVRRIMEHRTDLTSMLDAEHRATSAQVHWFDLTKLHASRVERRTAYATSLQTIACRITWICLYLEIRDQLLLRNGAGALALAQLLSRSVHASDSIEWQNLSDATLVGTYLSAGQLDKAERAMALLHEPPASNEMTEDTGACLLARCQLAHAKKSFAELLDRSTTLVEILRHRNDLMLQKANALQLFASAAYHLDMPGHAAVAIEDAVAIAESCGSSEPLFLRRLYDDAFLMTGRPRYRDALGDIMSIAHRDQKPRERDSRMGLTERQLQVAHLAAFGWNNHIIARELGISVRTVEKHVDALLMHFNIRSRHQLPAVLRPVS